MKKILSLLLTITMLTGVIPVNAEETDIETESTQAEELPVQSEFNSDPIIHEETVPYIELTDENDFGERKISTFAVTSSTENLWKTVMATELGSDFLTPYMQKQSGYDISGNTNRLVIRETDLFLKGKNGLDLSIRRKYDNQYSRMFFLSEKNSLSKVIHKRYIYSFKNLQTEETVNIGFILKDDFYTHFYDGVYLSQLPTKKYTEENESLDDGSTISYYRFEDVYSCLTTQENAAIALEYDSDVPPPFVREYVNDTSTILTSYRLLTSANQIGSGWIYELPEGMINLVYLNTYKGSSYKTQDFDAIGTFKDMNGNIYYFKGNGRLKSYTDESASVYTSTFLCNDNKHIQLESFCSMQSLYENGPEYNFVITDSQNLTYYFNNTGINSNGLSRTQPMYIVAIKDNYDNMIRYERKDDGLRIAKIIDTYGREINLSANGISYYDKESKKTKTITYDSVSVSSEDFQNNSYLSEKDAYKFIVTNESGEKTEYYCRNVTLLSHYESSTSTLNIATITDPNYEIFETRENYNIERIVYPDNSQVDFKYKLYYTQNGHLRNGIYAVEEVSSQQDGIKKEHKKYTLSGLGYVSKITTEDLSRKSKKIEEYDIDGLLKKSTYSKDGTSDSYNSIYQVFGYDEYNHPQSTLIYNFSQVHSTSHTYRAGYSDTLTETHDNKEKINYTYHTKNGKLTRIPETITYSYYDNYWKIDYIVRTTLTDDNKAIEYQFVTKNDEIKEKTKYSYDQYGEVTSTKYWVGDTNNDGEWDDNDETVTVNNSYSVTENDTLSIAQSIGGLTDADGNSINDITTVYGYDIHGNPTSRTSPQNAITTISYDDLGRPVRYRYPDYTEETIQYNSILNYAIVTDKAGKQSKFEYDSFGNPTKESFKENDEWKVTAEYSYDNANRLAEAKEYSDETLYTKKQYEYDIFDRVTKERTYDNNNELICTRTYTYTNGGECTKTITTSPSGSILAETEDYYDNFGRKTKTTMKDGSDYISTETTYDYKDRVVKETDPNYNVTSYTYDYLGNLLTSKDSLGNSVSYTYDALGRQKTVTDKNGNTTTQYHDNAGRVIKTVSPFDNSSTAVTKNYYDADSNVTAVKIQNNATADPESFRTVNYEYDSMGRITKSYGDADYVSYEYDSFGRPSKMSVGSDENVKISYSYDSRGFLASETDALGLSTEYTYDYVGNVKTMTDKNGVLHSNTYGVFGVTLQTSTKDGVQESCSYQYDSLGRLISKTLNNGADIASYTYDRLGRIKTSTSNGAVNSYTYDNNSNIISYSLTENGTVKNTITYEYDKLNRLTKETIGDTILTYSYDNNSNMTGKTIGSNVTTISYNKANLPVNMVNVGFSNTEYGYSLDGNRISETDTLRNINKNYQYDAKGRLVFEQQTGAENLTKTYEYDAFGNRTSLNEFGKGVTSYTYDANNRLLNEINTDSSGELISRTNYYYDNNGNQTKKQNLTFSESGEAGISIGTIANSTVSVYSYNHNNQLIGYQDCDTTATYSYNAEGLRKEKTVNGATTGYIWNNGNMVAERVNGTIANLYNYGVDGIVSSVTGSTTEYYMKNVHGDVIGRTNTSGTVTGNSNYDAFGNVLTEQNTNPFGYCGEYQDLCSGLIYLRNRYYDPSIGRFISEDPARDGLNWYVYCNNDPVNRIDPEGTASFREKWEALWKVGPFDATSINNIGNSTLIAAQDYALENGLTSVTDNIADAYRHFSWNYDAVKKGVSVEDVMQATTNHEVLTQKYMGKDSNGIKYYKVALSSLMDLQNNKAGRYQATLNANSNKTSREVFDRLASYGGVVTSLEHVKQIWGIKDDWLYSATDGVRGEVSVLIKNGLEENALNIVVVNKNEIKFK